jgi:carbon storage regulator
MENSLKASINMEIRTIEYEHKLVLIINNQKIDITPFLMKDDLGNIKLGINAPRGIDVNREEIFNRKKEKLKGLGLKIVCRSVNSTQVPN